MFCYGSWFYILLYRIWKIRYDKNTNIRKMITNTWSKRKDSSTCTKNWVTLSGWSWTTTTARRRCHSRGSGGVYPPAVPALVLSAVCDSINTCDSVPCLIKVSRPPPRDPPLGWVESWPSTEFFKFVCVCIESTWWQTYVNVVLTVLVVCSQCDIHQLHNCVYTTCLYKIHGLRSSQAGTLHPSLLWWYQALPFYEITLHFWLKYTQYDFIEKHLEVKT